MIADPRLGFSVNFLTTSAQSATVGGRCLDGPIRVGDVFTSLLEMTYDRTKVPRASYRHLHAVRLRIDSIAFFRQLTDRLGPVESGELVLSGTGIELLRVEQVLATP